MRFKSVLCAILVALPGAAAANDLLQVFEQAQRNDATFAAAAFARDAAIEARPQARAALLPQVSGTYQLGHTETDSTSERCQDPDNPEVIITNCPTINIPSDDEGVTLTLRQTLFDWAAFQRLLQAGEEVALAETTYQRAQQDLVLRVATAYFDVLAAEDTLRSAQAENKAVERQLEQAQKRFEVGLSAITDVQEAQARYDLTVADQIAAQQVLSAAREALAQITGTPAATSLATLQDEIPLPAPDPTTVNSWVNAAAEGNLDVLSARHAMEIAKKGVTIARSGHLPTLGAQAQYFDGTRGDRFGAADIQQEQYGVQLTVPIFSGLATQSGVRQSRATYAQREAEYVGTKRLVERQTRDAYQGVISGASRVKALRQAVVSSATALEASETGLQVGARTAVDVLNAQQQLYFAERNYYRARYDYLLSVLRLKAAAGKLGAKDLAEIDRLLIDG